MTVLEMHTAVQLGLDKSSSLQLAAFEPEEIDYWLNEAQTELVKRKAFGNNYRQESYSQGVKRMEDLTTLVKEHTFSTTTAHAFYPNVVTVDPTAITAHPYMFYIDLSVTYTGGKKAVTTLIETGDIKNLIETEYNKPFLRVPYSYIADTKIAIIKDPYAPAITSAYLKYIKRPGKLVRATPGTNEVTTSELPVQVHTELVALTVILLLENIEAERRLQTNTLMFNNKE